MFLVDYGVVILLSLVIVFEGMIIFYALRRINVYEQIFTELVGIIDYIKAQMDIIDHKGTFRAVKNMSNILSGLFDKEEDGNAK